MNATFAQVKLLRLLKRKLKMTDDDYNTITQCDGEGNVDFKTARKLISKWKAEAIKLGVWEDRKPVLKYDNLATRDARFATPEQLRKIDSMWSVISRQKTEAERDAALKIFLQRRFKILSIEAVQRSDVRKIIMALDAMEKQPTSGQMLDIFSGAEPVAVDLLKGGNAEAMDIFRTQGLPAAMSRLKEVQNDV